MIGLFLKRSRKNMSRALGIPFFFHCETAASCTTHKRETSVVPPNALITSLESSGFSLLYDSAILIYICENLIFLKYIPS